MLYEITAAVETRHGPRRNLRQVPTFFLDSNVQGIRDAEHAKAIATRIHVGNEDVPSVRVHVTAYPVETL